MNIEIFGGSERVRSAKNALLESDCGVESIKLLPVPSSRDGVHITGTEILFDDFLEGIESGSFVIGYGIPQFVKDGITARNAACYDAGNDECFLVENAYITAIGALTYLLQSVKKIPCDLKFGIIGYGRIGSALARLLLFLGARVKIFSSKKLTRIELGLCGIDSPAVDLATLESSAFLGLDVIFNTAPTKLSHLFPKRSLPCGVRVFDLASGDSFPGVRGVEYLPSIPDRMYPESAGKTYAACALAAIMDKKVK